MINKRILTSVIFLFLAFAALAQDAAPTKKVAARPDIPGNFLVDMGLNLGINPPDSAYKKGLFGSRTLNIYYYYPIRIGESKFSFNPGIGMSMERIKWANLRILRDTTANEEIYSLIPNTEYQKLKKSMLIMNYLEMPLEFRFDANPSDPARTFWVSAGARIGILADAHSKLKFKKDGEKSMLKEHWRHGVSPVRYAAVLRWGVAGFGWFTAYNLTPLFEKGKGPSRTEMSILTVGITINGL
jgi:hypothetical protein